MTRRCDCGCKRPARGEWLHPLHGSFSFAALCNIRHKDALEAHGFAHFPQLDDRADEQPMVTLTGGPLDAPLD